MHDPHRAAGKGPASPALGGEDRCERHGAVVLRVHPDVELAWRGLEAAVAVAVEVEPALAHVLPRAKGVVAEDELRALDVELGVGLHARPYGLIERRPGVVVPGDEVLAAVQRREDLADALGRAAGKIAEVPNLVVRPDGLVPGPDQGRIMLGDGRE